MNQYIRPIAAALCFGVLMLMATMSSAQQKGANLDQIAQYLNLTPEQKAKILPILADEVPKVKAIKEDPSFSRMQRTQRIKAIHQQTDPQMKAILSPEQYQKLQAMRHKTLADAKH